MGLFSFLNQEIAIDLGTANTLIIENDKVVVDEPSIIAKNRTTGTVIAIGKRAMQMHGKTHEEIKTIRPLKDGAGDEQKTGKDPSACNDPKQDGVLVALDMLNYIGRTCADGLNAPQQKQQTPNGGDACNDGQTHHPQDNQCPPLAQKLVHKCHCSRLSSRFLTHVGYGLSNGEEKLIIASDLVLWCCSFGHS